MIFIDEVPLDRFLETHAPDSEALGLVPTWLDWMADDREQAIAWERMTPPATGRLRVPVLTCPDDLDFSCSLIVADLEAMPGRICWHRMGLDQSDTSDPSRVGEEVFWFEGVSELSFPRAEYEECVKAFQKANRAQPK